MNYYELELNGESYKLRLTSGNAVALEKKTNTKLLDYFQDYGMQTIITLLRYLMMADKPNASEQDACNLYDKLVDNGYTLEKILYGVVYETLVVSGFLTKEELQQMTTITQENKKKVQEVLEK